MGIVTQDVTTNNQNGTSTRSWKYEWGGNTFGVNDKNRLDVSGSIITVNINNGGGTTTVVEGGQGYTYVELNSHSGGGFDGGNCAVTIIFHS